MMLNVTFKGEPFLFVGQSLEQSGAITTVEAFTHGRVSYAHYWPNNDGIVKRYNKVIGSRADIEVIGEAESPAMTFDDMLLAFDNMLGGDPGWFEEPENE